MLSHLFFIQNIGAQFVLSVGEGGGDELSEVLVFQDEITVGGVFQQELGGATSHGALDIFIQQYNLQGQINWQYQLGTTQNDALQGMTCSPNGFLLSAGVFRDSLFVGTDTTLYSNRPAIFVCKQNQQGTLLWAKHWNGQSLLQVEDIVSDGQDHIYITGAFQDTFNVDSSHQLIGHAKNNLFLIKMNAAGQVLWASQAAYAEESLGKTMCLDANGNLYLLGLFKGELALVQDTIEAHWVYNDLVLTQVDSQGNWLWQKHYGGVYDNDAAAIKWMDGYLYLGGNFRGVLDIDTIRLVTDFRDHWDGYLAKLNTDGTVVWAFQSKTRADCFVTDFAFYNHQIVVCGNFGDSLVWEGNKVMGTDGLEVFQLAMNTDGGQRKLTTWKGNGYDLARANAIHSTGQLVTGGGFQQNITIDSSFLQAQGFSDGFLVLEPPIVLATTNIPSVETYIEIALMPNPSQDVTRIVYPEERLKHWTLYNMNGQLVAEGHQVDIALEGLAAGMYSIHIVTEEGMAIEKLIKN